MAFDAAGEPLLPVRGAKRPQCAERRGDPGLIGRIIGEWFDIAPDFDDSEAVCRSHLKRFLDAVWSNGPELDEVARNAEHQYSRSPINPIDEEVEPSLYQSARIAFEVSPPVGVHKASWALRRAAQGTLNPLKPERLPMAHKMKEPYKTDADTHAGKYSRNGVRVSKRYE
ncbi:MAG: hypothetical protein ACYDCZ_11905 [Vulcanimicrobiaceae bacterium]